MTTRRNALLTFGITALLFPFALTAQAQKSDEQAIKAAYAAGDTLYRKKDVTKLMKMLTPDATYKETSGKTLTHKEMDALMKTQLASITSIDSFKTTIKKLTIKGTTAESETSMTLKGKIKDPQGKMHTMASTSVTHDVWTKTPQGWRIKQIEAVSDKVLIDGKPAN